MTLKKQISILKKEGYKLSQINIAFPTSNKNIYFFTITNFFIKNYESSEIKDTIKTNNSIIIFLK